MKVSMLGLALSTVAFGASSIYLWQQLEAERARNAEFVAASKELNTRIATLEKARAEFAERRFAGPAPIGGELVAQTGAAPGQDPQSATADEQKAGFAARTIGPGQRPPEMPPAMIKMMRAQMRAQNKRTYFDLQDSLGISEDQANKLIDIITDQQAASFSVARNSTDPAQQQAQWEAARDKQKNDITDLLGPTKAAQWDELQKTMPARMELQSLAQQFESVEAPLSSDQSKRMLAVLLEERERVPAPVFSAGASQEEMTKSYAAWQSDYEERVASQARGILSSAQLTTYNEYQQWQKEMREQFAAQGMPRMRGNVVAAPAMLGSGVAISVTTSTPVEAPQESKPKAK
jgi:hypothetical protein